MKPGTLSIVGFCCLVLSTIVVIWGQKPRIATKGLSLSKRSSPPTDAPMWCRVPLSCWRSIQRLGRYVGRQFSMGKIILCASACTSPTRMTKQKLNGSKSKSRPRCHLIGLSATSNRPRAHQMTRSA